MNNVVAIQDRREPMEQALRMLPHEITFALSDNSYSSVAWSASTALRQLRNSNSGLNIVALAERVRLACDPVDRDWAIDRITTLGLAFGTERDTQRATAWVHEMVRLLADLPRDIFGHAVDEATKRSERGFVPRPGEIRAIADPLFEARKLHAARLAAVARAATPTAVPAPSSSSAPTTPEEDRLDPAMVARTNATMRRMGLRTRFYEDGRSYVLTADEAEAELA